MDQQILGKLPISIQITDLINSKLRCETILSILGYLDTSRLQIIIKEVFIHVIFGKKQYYSPTQMSKLGKYMTIIEKFENICLTQEGITEIFDYACKLGCIKEVILLMINFKKQFSNHNICSKVIEVHNNSINETFREALLCNDHETIKIFQKHNILSKARIAAEILIHTKQLNESDANKMMGLILDAFYHKTITEVFDVICQKKDVNTAIELFTKFQEKIDDYCINGDVITKYKNDIDKIFDQALRYGDTGTIKTLTKNGIKSSMEMINGALDVMQLNQQKASEVASLAGDAETITIPTKHDIKLPKEMQIEVSEEAMQRSQQNASEVIITIINFYYATEDDAHDIFDEICNTMGVEFTIKFLVNHQKKIRYCRSFKCYILEHHRKDIKKMFDEAFLNGDTEVMKIFTKHHIQSSMQIVGLMLNKMPNDERNTNAEKVIVTMINEYFGDLRILEIIREKKGDKYMIQFLLEYKHSIKGRFIDKMFEQALSTQNYEAFKNHSIEVHRQMIIEAFVYAAKLYPQQPSGELMDKIISMAPKQLSINDNDITEIFSDVCKKNNTTYITNLVLLFSKYKDVILNCKINKCVIDEYQDVVDEAFNALSIQDDQTRSMYIKFGIKLPEQPYDELSNIKSYQQSILEEHSLQQFKQQ